MPSSLQHVAAVSVLVVHCIHAVTITKLPLPGVSETPLVIKGTATFLTSAEAARMRRRGLPPPQPSDTVRTTYRADGNPPARSHWREPGFYSAPSDGGENRNYMFGSNEVVDRTYNEDRDYYPMFYTPPEEKRCKDRDCRDGNSQRRPIKFGYDANAPSSSNYRGDGPSWPSQGEGRKPDWGPRRNPFITSSSGRFREDEGRRDFQDPGRRGPDSERRNTWSRYPGGGDFNGDTRNLRDRPFGSYDLQREDSPRGFNGRPWEYPRNRNQYPEGGTSTGWHNGRGIAHIDRFQGSSSTRNYDVRGGGPDFPRGRDDSDRWGYRGPPRGRSVGDFPSDERRRRWSRDCVGPREGRGFNDVDCSEYEAIVGFYGRWRREG